MGHWQALRRVSAMSAEPTVFVVEDDQAVRRTLRGLFEAQGHNVETFASPREFLDACDPDRPGCLIVDLRMPEMSGLELCEQLDRRKVGIPAIVLTGHGDVPTAVRAMKAGVVDFLEKPPDHQVLFARVREALDLDARRRSEHAESAVFISRMQQLTTRESEVLDLVVQGLANKQIAHQLGICDKTVEAHRKHIMHKLGTRSSVNLVRQVLEARAHEASHSSPTD